MGWMTRADDAMAWAWPPLEVWVPRLERVARRWGAQLEAWSQRHQRLAPPATATAFMVPWCFFLAWGRIGELGHLVATGGSVAILAAFAVLGLAVRWLWTLRRRRTPAAE